MKRNARWRRVISDAEVTGSEVAALREGSPLLSTSGLSKKYANFSAVKDVSLNVRQGEFTGIIGPNGAGKTTFFNLLSGQLTPTSGTISYKGEDITRTHPHVRVRRGMGRSFQVTNVFSGHTVFENVRIAVQAKRHSHYDYLARVRSLSGVNERTTALLEKIGLEGLVNYQAGLLSHGDQRRLEVGVMLALDPELLLLDEPTAGMTRADARGFTDFLVDIAEGRTILFIEHNIELVMSVSHQVAVLQRGALIAEGTPEDIRKNKDVQRAYLGPLNE